MGLTVGLLSTWQEPGQRGRDKFLGFARLADELGFDRLWVGDSPMIWQDVYVALTLAAVHTSRISLGSGVTHPTLRHPAVTASASATLNTVSNGRMVIGFGAGDSAHGTTGIKPADAQSVKAAIQLIRDLVQGKEVIQNGHPVKLTGSQQHIPIYWSTARRSCLAMAGEVADGVILPSPIDAGILSEQIRTVREGAEAAGRDPAEVTICLWTNSYVSDDPREIERVKFECRATATSRLRHSRYWLSPELRQRAIEIRAQYDYYRHSKPQADQYERTPIEVVDMMTMIGTREECLRKLELCQQVGVQELMLGVSHFQDDHQMLERLAKDFLPAARQPAGASAGR
jgi:alkanesulfonate monooxygenase SsuD/methylene tetrahydromethanopterin reductase-like flavin-dependent oxidoreductase (luciferase family)